MIDTRIANEVLTDTTTYNGSVSGDPGIIDSQDDVGGWPVLVEITRDPGYETDQDGMPDVWETGNVLNPNDPNLPSGIYIIKVADISKKSYTRKLIMK